MSKMVLGNFGTSQKSPIKFWQLPKCSWKNLEKIWEKFQNVLGKIWKFAELSWEILGISKIFSAQFGNL